MTATEEVHVRVDVDGDVALAAVQARKTAEAGGFTKDAALMLATAASELARNIIKYAGRGEVVVRPVADGARTGLEIVARDHGPGIADVESALQDHVSTSGTLGLGLPGVRRMMDEFDIHAPPGGGTQVIVRKWL